MRGETITILRQGESTSEDSQGNPIYPTLEISVAGCAFAPRASDETLDVFGGRVLTGGTVYLPSGTEIRSSDVLVIRGERWLVDGDAGQWTNPFSRRGRGVEVAVKRGG
jgi:hypothetical protein